MLKIILLGFLITFTMNIHLENHDQTNISVDPASNTIGVQNLVNTLTTAQPLKCSTRFLRTTYVNFINSNPSQSVNWDTEKINSGKNYIGGFNTIPPLGTQNISYTKLTRIPSGSCGVISLKYKTKKVVILYENPWSSWPGAGLCVFDDSYKVEKGTYNKMYDDMVAYSQTITT